jgi:hypothetical protein
MSKTIKPKAVSKGPRSALAGSKIHSIGKVAKAGIKVTPVRLEPTLRLGLAMLQSVLKTPVNKLINQAVGDFINRRTTEVETDMKAVLKEVRGYRKRDPKFKEAIRRTAEDEAQAFKERLGDPAQGTTYVIRKKDVGPAQSMLQELLNR